MTERPSTGLLVLLGFVPVAITLHFVAPERHVPIFFASVLAILPLAALIGNATEALASRLGGGIGGLLNATFGNAAELIIGVLALREGLTDLVKASLTGSIIGNVLLVFGASALVGGLRHPVQRFNRTAAGLGTTMLLSPRDPVLRTVQRLAPLGAARVGLRAWHRRLESLVNAPVTSERVDRVPEADRQAGEIGSAKGRRLGDARSYDRDAEHVSLKLQKRVVGRCAPVNA